jgi:hypothetical protein
MNEWGYCMQNTELDFTAIDEILKDFNIDDLQIDMDLDFIKDFLDFDLDILCLNMDFCGLIL